MYNNAYPEVNTMDTNEILLQLLEGQKQMNERLDGMDARFDGIDKRLDGMDARFDGIDKRLDGMDARFDGIDKRLDGIDNRLDKIETRLDNLEENEKVTRFAVNHIGEKLEDLIEVLNATNVVSFKY